MRLLRIVRSTKAESGGPIEGAILTSEILVREGHDVEVLALEAEEIADQRSFPFPVTRLGRGTSRYGYNHRLVPWLRHNAPRFDAVVLHGLWNYSSVGSWRALRHLDIPYFVYTHGMMDPWFREAYPLKHLAKQLYWWLGEGRVLRDARAVFFTSEEERMRAQHVFSGYSYNERVVLYGAADPVGDPERQKKVFLNAFPQLKGRRFLMFLGRIHPKKGCDLLLRAFAETLGSIDDDIDLVMAGPDQLGWVDKLQTMASELGVNRRVHWTGMLTGDLKWGGLRSAEAEILPSHQENFGIVVAEALACSTPVLISNKVNIWREVEKAGAGLVAPDTIEGTQTLLRSFWGKSEEDRMRMRTAARTAFLEAFNIEAAGLDLIRQLGFSNDSPVTPRRSGSTESARA